MYSFPATGHGTKSRITFRRFLIPIDFIDEPQITGIRLHLSTCSFNPVLICSSVSVSPSRNFSISSSSPSAASSTRFDRSSSASSFISAGISVTWTVLPPSFGLMAFMSIISITPLNDSPSPCGRHSVAVLAPSLVLIFSIISS